MKNPIVSAEEWRKKRLELLQKEKEFTKLRDQLSTERRSLPWVKIKKDYRFLSVKGEKSFADLFEGKSQLIIYHFMFGPGTIVGCKSCSFWTDQYDPIIVHIRQRDANLIGVSRGEIEKMEAFRKRMGWQFQWVSSIENDFNDDFHVTLQSGQPSQYNYKSVITRGGEWPGISVFYKDEDEAIYHTYSTYARGLEDLNTVYRYLDILPKGRDEDDLPYGMAWVKLRDEY